MSRDMAELRRHMSDDTLALNQDLWPDKVVAFYGEDPEMVMRKYHNQPTTVDGMTFDSKAEAVRFLVLRTLERSGMISALRRQVEYELLPSFVDNRGKRQRGVTYVADFVYTEAGVTVIEDVKSEITRRHPVFRLKWRMLAHQMRDRADVELREHRSKG